MLGDNMESLKQLEDNSIDALVTDGPYGLSFMSKKWDYDVPTVEFWQEAFRVLKPGGHVLSFGGTRTYHRMVVNIEDAGFEVRDQIQWLYGAGFPKSHNIGKSVDKINGVSNWEGWGTALKPANEPICLAKKPISEKTIADNVLRWGTGGINIDGCRIEGAYGTGQNEVLERDADIFNDGENKMTGHKKKIIVSNELGRFPANLILDEEAGTILDEQSGIGASRFFYKAKVGKKERNMGLDENTKSTHPTVKPVSLMAYLCRLITPPNGIVLDPFMGSGSTGIAANLEGFSFIGMEMDEDYFKIAEARIEAYKEYAQFNKNK